MRPHNSYKSLRTVDTDAKYQRDYTNLEKMYGKNEKLEEYTRDKELMQKRDETKAELKMLLKKYVSQADHDSLCAMRVGEAQKAMHSLHGRMDKAVRAIEQCEEHCK